ncbi:MAG: hypothetical protein LC722_02285 [Actinobacteria bacterium]|nr:hypothetical protein [Actinomycetota bacterium]
MHLLRRSAASRIALLALSVTLIIGAFAVPALAAHRNQFIHTVELFENSGGSLPDCANGWFEASGQVDANGSSRSCARGFGRSGKVVGTTQLHNGDDLTVSWRIDCTFDGTDRARHFSCEGQWSVNGPNWKGGGSARAVLDFTVPPYGQVEFTFNGNLTAV